MTGVLSIIAAILAVSLLIIIHECGHYFAARAVGMRVERFSFGFGPVLLSVRRGDTLFELRAVPIGGFVAVPMRAEPAPAPAPADAAPGAAPAASAEPADPGVYANKPAWARFAFVFAGPVMNWVAAVLVAWVLLASVGLGVADPASRVGQLLPGMPAEKAGLRSGDRIEAVGDVPVSTWEELVREIQGHPGQPVTFKISRGEGASAASQELRVTPTPAGKVGFGPAELTVRTGALEALPAAVKLTNANLGAQLYGFASILSRKQRAELSGPIGIAQELVRGARAGLERFLKLVWTISVGLAVLNLLPFPGLDGSRLLFLAYELVTRRRVNERVEGLIHAGGLVVLIALIIAVSFGDVARLLR